MLAPTAPPVHDGAAPTKPPLMRGASVLLTLPNTPAPARSVLHSRGMTIVRKFGGSTAGLSVTGSSFAAPLPTPEEAAATGADLNAIPAAHQPDLPVARGTALAPGGGLNASPPPGSAWTTVDVGDRGLLDAVLDTLVHTHRT